MRQRYQNYFTYTYRKRKALSTTGDERIGEPDADDPVVGIWNLRIKHKKILK